MKKKQVPLTPVLAVALAIVLAVVFFALVSPKRAESSRIDAEMADLQMRVATATRATNAPPEPKVEIEVADLFRLAKAMPDTDNMPGIILELNAIASSAGVRFVSIQPQTSAALGSYHTVPIALVFEGNYYDLTDFLYRLRNLVSVKDGILSANGRLYTLDQIALREAESGFPSIVAELTVSAYAFGATPTPAPGTPPAPTETTTTGTTGTDTTQTDTTGTDTTQTDTTSTDAGQQALGGNG